MCLTKRNVSLSLYTRAREFSDGVTVNNCNAKNKQTCETEQNNCKCAFSFVSRLTLEYSAYILKQPMNVQWNGSSISSITSENKCGTTSYRDFEGQTYEIPFFDKHHTHKNHLEGIWRISTGKKESNIWHIITRTPGLLPLHPLLSQCMMYSHHILFSSLKPVNITVIFLLQRSFS